MGKEENKWYVFDVKYHPGAFQDVYIRGICSVSHAESGIKTVRRVAVILLPTAGAFYGRRRIFLYWTIPLAGKTDLQKLSAAFKKTEICPKESDFPTEKMKSAKWQIPLMTC